MSKKTLVQMTTTPEQRAEYLQWYIQREVELAVADIMREAGMNVPPPTGRAAILERTDAPYGLRPSVSTLYVWQRAEPRFPEWRKAAHEAIQADLAHDFNTITWPEAMARLRRIIREGSDNDAIKAIRTAAALPERFLPQEQARGFSELVQKLTEGGAFEGVALIEEQVQRRTLMLKKKREQEAGEVIDSSARTVE